MEQKPQLPFNRTAVVVLAGALLVVAVSLYFYLGAIQSQKRRQVQTSPAPAASTAPNAPQTREGFPVLSADKFTQRYTPPSPPESLREYQFVLPKEADARQLAERLGIRGRSMKDGDMLAIASTDEASFFLLDQQTGRMLYTSAAGFDVSSAGGNLDEALRRLGLTDSTMIRTGSYKMRSEPGLTFYEYRLDPRVVGSPVYNMVGLLNLPESQPLSLLSQAPPQDIPPDPEIYATSDQRDGKARANDFNTLTVGVTDTGRIVKIESNIRRINTGASTRKVRSHDEALELLRAGKTDTFISLPSGGGVVDAGKVYPGNRGRFREAIITESIIAYHQEPGILQQVFMEPYWVFRGYGELESGYRVKFIATVPALTDETVSWLFHRFGIPQARAAEPSTLAQQQQGTLTSPDPEPPTPPPTKPPTATAAPDRPSAPPSPSPSPVKGETPGRQLSSPTAAPSVSLTSWDRGYELPFQDCNPTAEMLQGKFSLLGYTFGYYDKFKIGGEWYMVVNNLPPRESLLNWITPIVDAVRGRVGNVREPVRIAEDLRGFISAGDRARGCPVRLTGYSPSVFLYGSVGSVYTVRAGASLTYADPIPTSNTWTVTLTEDGLLSGHDRREFLYYEYAPKTVRLPETGWIISRDGLDQLAARIAEQLKLTRREAERLIFELSHALPAADTPYLYVGLADASDVAAMLPLDVFPKPERMYRYHFVVHPLQNKNQLAPLAEPELTPIPRAGTLLVELGGLRAEY